MANGRFRRYHRRPRRNGHGSRAWVKALAAFLVLASGALAGLAAVGVGVAFGVYEHYAAGLQTPEERIRTTVPGGAWLYDRNGTLLYQFADPDSGLRDPVKLDKIAKPMIDATVSTEDASFYDNPGVNVRGLVRAASENLLPGGGFDFLEGSGGSSITQQLVKNLYIDYEERIQRSIPRKMKETVIALELTRKYSKDQIMEWYLNHIFYGNNSYGVETAARRYFDKHASEIDLAEAAMLAGIPASPTVYDPFANPSAAKARQEEVLDLMARHGVIPQEEADAAKAEELQFRGADQSLLLAPHWVFHLWNPETNEGVLMDMCRANLISKPANQTCEELLKRGGLRVTTTLDLNLQSKAEEILRTWIARYEGLSRGHNGAMMTVDARTGEVLVYVGSRDYFNADILGKNDNIQALNSPGSSFKPFTYLTAFLQGWAPASTVWDTPVKIKGGDGREFQPINPNRDYKGPITVRTALGASLNVPAVKTMNEIGVGPVIDQARKMGITSLRDKNRYGPSLTVGGGEVTLNDMVFGFSAFANNGVEYGVPSYRGDKPDWWPELQPAAVLKITNDQGEVLYEFKPEERRVAPAPESYLITSILSDDVARSPTFGRGSSLNLSGRPSAVKTGTSEPYENSRAIGETWAIGYTPQLVTGVWVGNADNSPMYDITSATVAARSWNEFMTAALEALDLGPKPFTEPPGLVRSPYPQPGGGCGLSGNDIFPAGNTRTFVHAYCRLVQIDRRTGLPATASTPRDQIIERFGPDIPAGERGYGAPAVTPSPTGTPAASPTPYNPFAGTPVPPPAATPFNPFAGTPVPSSPPRR